jgi:microcin C transport system permease protein
MGATARVSGAGGETLSGQSGRERQHGLSPETIAQIEKMYGFDKPASERFTTMLWQYLRFDFGESFFRNISVLDLMLEKMPVSISLGLWSTLIVYLISIPLGIKKAVNHGSHFDLWTSTLITVSYAIPGFLFAILLIVFFAGGSFLDWFPLRGLTSDNFDQLSTWQQIKDYLWHLALPLTAYTIGGFATLTMLTKNSFLDEINKQYVVTARAKGLQQNQVLYGHVFRNGMLIIIAGFPSAFLSMFFTGSMLIEVIFSLDGLGLLGFESVVNRDYPVIFATLYLFTLLGLLMKLLSDLMYVWVDPRIDFEGRSH